jgi:hypothetical protein
MASPATKRQKSSHAIRIVVFFELSDLVVPVVNDLTKCTRELVSPILVPDHRSDECASDPI